jgi:Domain of Unknown Function (DUF1080)
MTRTVLLTLTFALATHAATNPFIGRWDFDVPAPHGIGANWLGISGSGDNLDIWFQPTGGHVHPVKDYKLNGSHLTLNVSPKMVWELDASNGQLTGTQKEGAKTIALKGVPAPALPAHPVKSWSNPEPLFDGKDLSGWQPIGDVAHNNWTVQDGLLVNTSHGANLKTTRTSTDFKLHFEVNCPDDANSGFYLRGRYEVQLEYEPAGANPPNRSIGSIYGRITPSAVLPRTPGQWETFDVTLIGRTVTITRDGTKIIDGKEIEGITGGALDADEGQPGPFYIQGDHTGGLKFRNITVSVPK